MRNKVLVAVTLLVASFVAGSPAHAFGPGGLARNLVSAPVLSGGNLALPEAARTNARRYCAAFGECLSGRSIAILASWKAGRDAVMPLDRLTLTSSEAENLIAALRAEIAPLAAPALEETVDFGILTGSVPAAGRPF